MSVIAGGPTREEKRNDHGRDTSPHAHDENRMKSYCERITYLFDGGR